MSGPGGPGYGVVEAAAGRRAHLGQGRLAQPEPAQGKDMAAVDGRKMVDERAIEVEEDGAETHAGNNCAVAAHPLARKKSCRPSSRGRKISLAHLPAPFTLPPSISSDSAPTAAPADASLAGDTLTVRAGGDWRITAPHPDWIDLIGDRQPRRVVLSGAELGAWDSS